MKNVSASIRGCQLRGLYYCNEFAAALLYDEPTCPEGMLTSGCADAKTLFRSIVYVHDLNWADWLLEMGGAFLVVGTMIYKKFAKLEDFRVLTDKIILTMLLIDLVVEATAIAHIRKYDLLGTTERLYHEYCFTQGDAALMMGECLSLFNDVFAYGMLQVCASCVGLANAIMDWSIMKRNREAGEEVEDGEEDD